MIVLQIVIYSLLAVFLTRSHCVNVQGKNKQTKNVLKIDKFVKCLKVGMVFETDLNFCFENRFQMQKFLMRCLMLSHKKFTFDSEDWLRKVMKLQQNLLTITTSQRPSQIQSAVQLFQHPGKLQQIIKIVRVETLISYFF